MVEEPDARIDAGPPLALDAKGHAYRSLGSRAHDDGRALQGRRRYCSELGEHELVLCRQADGDPDRVRIAPHSEPELLEAICTVSGAVHRHVDEVRRTRRALEAGGE